MKLPLVVKEIDKANHFIIGTIIYCFANIFVSCYLSLGAVILTALFKEFTDETFDFKDLLYSILGAIPVFILNLLQ